MRWPTASGIAFALRAGEPDDATTRIRVEPGPDGGPGLLAMVEPLEPGGHAADVAAIALSALTGAFAGAIAESAPPAVALVRAFAAANAAVRDENRLHPGDGRCRRVLVGATAVALDGRSLVVAQVPPTQTIIAQDALLYPLPDLASWLPDYLPEIDRPVPEPLGQDERVAPALFRTTALGGDVIVLCCTAIARVLARQLPDPDLPDAEGVAVAALRRGDAAGTLAAIEELAVLHQVDHAHAAVIALDRPQGAALVLPTGELAEVAARIGAAWTAVAPRVRSARSATAAVSAPAATAGVAPAFTGFWGAGATRRRVSLTGLGIPLDRPLDAGAGLARDDRDGDPAPSGWIAAPPSSGFVPPGPVPAGSGGALRPASGGAWFAAGPGDRGASAARSRPAGAAARALLASRALVAGMWGRLTPPRRSPKARDAAALALLPGAYGLHRYREHGAGPMGGWRANLPRGPVVRLPRRLLGGALLVGLVAGGSGYGYDRYRDHQDRLAAALAGADRQLAALDAAGPTDAPAQLRVAQDALDNAASRGVAIELVSGRQAELDRARDEIHAIVRLDDLTRLGTLPPDLAARSPRLVRAGREVFLVAGGLYRVDPGAWLQPILVSGQTLADGTVVGPLHDAALDPAGGGLVTSDGERLYARDAAGEWTGQPLGRFPGAAAWGAGVSVLAPYAAFEGNLYVLDAAAGRIAKFAAADLGADATGWSSADDAAALTGARDLIVDGRIVVLLADGRILTLFRGEQEAAFAAPVVPALAAPVALDGGADARHYYVAEPAAGSEHPGRIVRLDHEGGSVMQYLAPGAGTRGADPGADALAGIRDLAVDESAGVVYVLTADSVWRASIPRQELVAQG